jgi:hypothetical protein
MNNATVIGGRGEGHLSIPTSSNRVSPHGSRLNVVGTMPACRAGTTGFLACTGLLGGGGGGGIRPSRLKQAIKRQPWTELPAALWCPGCLENRLQNLHQTFVFPSVLSVFFCLSVCLSVCLPCLPTCLSICLPACLSACLPTCLSVCLSVCLPAYLSVCLSVCLPDYLSVCLPDCLLACLPVCWPACPSACLPTCLSVCLSVCLLACLSVGLPACMSVCLPACLSVCLPAYLSVYSPACLPGVPDSSLFLLSLYFKCKYYKYEPYMLMYTVFI